VADLTFPGSNLLDPERFAAYLTGRTAAGSVLLIGIDGPGASGKSTLARDLARLIPGSAVVEGDDFYLPSAVRPSGDFAIGGQFDLRRLRDQVIEPGSRGEPISYQKYNWDTDQLGDWVELADGTALIVEGIYCTELAAREFYSCRVFCRAAADLRLSRGLARDGEEARRQWVEEWMPAEDKYLAAQDPEEAAHLVLDGSGTDSLHPQFEVLGGSWA
jgi:uridine kinase